jgi:hypothetical protein
LQDAYLYEITEGINMLRLDVELLLNKLDYVQALGLAADISGAVYRGSEGEDKRFWYETSTDTEVKSWLRCVLNQQQLPDMQWVERYISQQVWG